MLPLFPPVQDGLGSNRVHRLSLDAARCPGDVVSLPGAPGQETGPTWARFARLRSGVRDHMPPACWHEVLRCTSVTNSLVVGSISIISVSACDNGPRFVALPVNGSVACKPMNEKEYETEDETHCLWSPARAAHPLFIRTGLGLDGCKCVAENVSSSDVSVGGNDSGPIDSDFLKL